jgi:hypothetical protein
MDIIITGKVCLSCISVSCSHCLYQEQTDDQYAAWDQPNKVLGRVRMCDGLVVFMRKLPVGYFPVLGIDLS